MLRSVVVEASASAAAAALDVSVPGKRAGEGHIRSEGSVRGKGSFPGEGSVSGKGFGKGSFPGEGSVVVEASSAAVALDGSVPGKCAGEGHIRSEGSARGKGSFPGKGSVSGKGFGKESFPGEGSVSVKVSVPGKDLGEEGSLPIEGSVPLEDPVLGQGKERPAVGSDPVDTSKVSVPFDPEFPIMTRFRFRRLLAFLASTCFTGAFEALQVETGVFLDLTYLQRLVGNLQWEDAKSYIHEILPYSCMGVDGRALEDFLVHLSLMHAIACRHPMASDLIARFEQCYRDAALTDRNYANVVRTILSMRSEQVRLSVDWHLVGLKAAEIIRDLIIQSPEFSQFLRLPRTASDLYDVVNAFPQGFSPRRIRRVKKAGRVPGSVIAKYFLPKQSCQPSGQGMNHSVAGFLTDPSAWLRASFDEALKAGTRTALHQEHRIKYAYNEGMDRKRPWSNVSKDSDAGNLPKHPRIAGTWIPFISGDDNRTCSGNPTGTGSAS